MSMNFDARTMALAATVIAAILTLVMTVNLSRGGVYPGYRLWVVAIALQIASGALFTVRGFIPDIVDVYTPNILNTLSIVALCHGLLRFLGRPPSYAMFALAALGMLAYSVFFFAIDDILARIVIVSLLYGALLLRGAGAVLAEHSRLHSGAAYTGLVLAGLGGLNVLRLLVALHTGMRADFYDPAMVSALDSVAFGLVLIMLEVALAFSLLSLVTTRNEQELQAAEAAVRRLAALDPLTDVLNVREFAASAARAFTRARRLNLPLALLVLDIDHFKEVNDTCGHHIGNSVLKAAAELFRSQLRETDVLARLGGDEFAALLIDSDLARSAIVAERLRHAIARLPVEATRAPYTVTVSIGVACLQPGDADIDTLLLRADAAMYSAKVGGRDRVRVPISASAATRTVAGR